MLDELPVFVDTLDAPYVWKNHRQWLESIILSAAARKRDSDYFQRAVSTSSKDDNAGHSPDVFFTPCKKRRRVSVTPEDKYQVSDLDEARPNDVLDACRIVCRIYSMEFGSSFVDDYGTAVLVQIVFVQMYLGTGCLLIKSVDKQMPVSADTMSPWTSCAG